MSKRNTETVVSLRLGPESREFKDVGLEAIIAGRHGSDYTQEVIAKFADGEEFIIGNISTIHDFGGSGRIWSLVRGADAVTPLDNDDQIFFMSEAEALKAAFDWIQRELDGPKEADYPSRKDWFIALLAHNCEG